eukprot:999053-Pleurochrysis_carterae.AAC.1
MRTHAQHARTPDAHARAARRRSRTPRAPHRLTLRTLILESIVTPYQTKRQTTIATYLQNRQGQMRKNKRAKNCFHYSKTEME